MKIYLKFPGEIELVLELERMDRELVREKARNRMAYFNTICLLIGIFIVGSGLLRLAEITAGR